MLYREASTIFFLDSGPGGGGTYSGAATLTLSVSSPTSGTQANIYSGQVDLALSVSSVTSGSAITGGGTYSGAIDLALSVISATQGSPGFVYVGDVTLTLEVNALTTQGPLSRAFDPTTASLSESISDLVVGDDYDVTREITGIPSGALLTDAWFTLKAFGAATTDAALIEKTISASASASQGQITDTGASGTGQLFFSLSATETALITPDQLYEYDIQVLSNTGKYSTREKGLLLAIAQITV
jgi:hypothetical protein